MEEQKPFANKTSDRENPKKDRVGRPACKKRCKKEKQPKGPPYVEPKPKSCEHTEATPANPGTDETALDLLGGGGGGVNGLTPRGDNSREDGDKIKANSIWDRDLKGQQSQKKIFCFRADSHKLTQRPHKNRSRKTNQSILSLEAKDRRGGGAHGPPRNLQRSILRVLDTEETQGLPRLGNRPQDSKS